VFVLSLETETPVTNLDVLITELPFDKPEPPLFLERFEEERVPEKGTLRLLARVTGNPTPVITWLRCVQQKQHSCLVELVLTLFHGMSSHKQFGHTFVRCTEKSVM
jgi:hypothetical protein